MLADGWEKFSSVCFLCEIDGGEIKKYGSPCRQHVCGFVRLTSIILPHTFIH